MLAALRLGGRELSVALVGDASIRRLNRVFRGKDKPTDVLSFEQAPAPGTPSALLGDVIISIPTASRQARRHPREPWDEVVMLLAHGILHLLGFDHQNDAEEAQMLRKTRKLEQVAHAATRKLPRRTDRNATISAK